MAILGILILAGCVSSQPGAFHRVSDGARIDRHPPLIPAFKQARATCERAAKRSIRNSREPDVNQRTQNMNVVFEACLAERGYVRR
jgi:hypothetical protein